jgi:hypothetical protein
MMRMHKIVSFATVAALSACGERTAPQKGQAMAAPVLRRNVAAICEPAVAYPFLLDLPARGGFKLNMVPFDSIQLTRWFEVQLAKRIPAQRVVMVRLDSTRRNELRWLIPAIERAGAGAYQPDSTCVPPARIQAADAPAA